MRVGDCVVYNNLEEYEYRDMLSKRKFKEDTPEDREKLFENTPIIYRGDELYICPSEPKWEMRYNEVMEITDKDVENYIYGLHWVWSYYREKKVKRSWKERKVPTLKCMSEKMKCMSEKMKCMSEKLKCMEEEGEEEGEEERLRYIMNEEGMEMSWCNVRYMWESVCKEKR